MKRTFSQTLSRVTTVLLSALFFVLMGFFFTSSMTQAKEIILPITLDHPLLTQLIVQKYFTRPGNTVQLIDTTNGCNEIKLSQPRLKEQNGNLNVTTDTFVRLGLPLGDNCIMPLEWQGIVDVQLQPRLEPLTWQLFFETKEIHISDRANESHHVAKRIFNEVTPELKNFLGDFKIDLSPPIANLKASLLPLFSKDVQEETKIMLDTLHPGKVTTHVQGVTLNLLTQVKEEEHQISAPLTLTEEEVERLIAVWEVWDGFFIHLITSLSSQRLTNEEKDLLIALVLESRHTFVDKLQNQSLEQDFVRNQFISTWRQLSPLFRKHYLRSPGENVLAYFSFITANDALTTLDELGPTMGIEISRNGLVRLIKILQVEPEHLNYSEELNTPLRELFNGNSPLPENTKPLPSENIEILLNQHSPLHHFFNLFTSQAYAATPSFSDIKKWQAPDKNHGTFVGKVRDLLTKSSLSRLEYSTLPKEMHPFFKKLIPAIAWQESCFRQFIVKNKKLTYLLSYNNSSVGIMQINERVWRGIYERNRLRWDIHYNAFAGCEIIDLYLHKYILPKAAPAIIKDRALLASLVYALYNGGPGQYKKYLARHDKNSYFKSDQLFKQKYTWVKNGAWDEIDQCL